MAQLNELVIGKKYRRPKWGPWEYIKPIEGKMVPLFWGDIIATDWEPYDEPKKSLTFEEAVKCKKLRITPPKECTPLYEEYEYRMGRGWSLEELAVFDLAERRGWHMEEVE